MKTIDIVQNATFMPFTAPPCSNGPYEFFDREYFIITYRTDPAKLRAVVPEPLQIPEDALVSYEFIKMPNSTGFGDYTESGQVIPVIDAEGRKANYTHCMFLDDFGPTAGGRELWGFPKKMAKPSLTVDNTDTLLGTLNYGSVRVATGTMAYKYDRADKATVAQHMMETPNYLLKLIPHVDGTPRVCELVRYYLTDVTVKEAYVGPATLQLFDHVMAPVSQLPVLEIVSASHIVANLTLALGEVAVDYIADREQKHDSAFYNNPNAK